MLSIDLWDCFQSLSPPSFIHVHCMFLQSSTLRPQEFESVCCILAAVLNIGDIRLETNFHSHVGEVSFVQNSERVHDGKPLTSRHFRRIFNFIKMLHHGYQWLEEG